MKFLLGMAMVFALEVGGCTPIGLATSAAASVGIASQSQEGLSQSARDIGIKIKISDMWFRYSVAAFGKLHVAVQGGRVLITGIVQNPDLRVEAVRLAWQAEGVKQVINEIRVADSEGLPGYVHDKWITTRLRTALIFDKGVYSINYTIDTVQGTVYLMGIARSQAEMDRVIEIARSIAGVHQVVSYITLAGQQAQDNAKVQSARPSPASHLTSPAPAVPVTTPVLTGVDDGGNISAPVANGPPASFGAPLSPVQSHAILPP
jgi:osmotically-inducible protein OsmY